MKADLDISHRIAVYAGTQMDCLHLQLTLAGKGIDVEIEHGWSGGHTGVVDGAEALVFVSRSDLDDASPIVEGFKRSGQKNR